MRRLFHLAGCLLALGVFVGPAAGQEWGTIKGRIVWGGAKVPEPVDLTELVMKNPDKDWCLKDGKLLSEEWVINPKNKGIKWTFVWLTDGNPMNKKPLTIHPKLKDLDKKVVEIDQPVCLYVPHAIAIRQGQDLTARNTAKVAHNVLHVGPDIMGNPLVLPGKDFTLNGLKVENSPISLSCAIHPWMKAWVRIFDHPYFAITDDDGNFTIKDAPAGKFNLIVWHGSGGWRGGALGRQGEIITIEAGKETDLGNKIFPPPKKF